MLIRDARESDAAKLVRIYGHYVTTSCFTFEETPPALDEMAARLRKIREAGLPYIVAEKTGQVLAFAYAGPFHSRSAYRFTVENSVYVAPDLVRQGLGLGLMRRLIEQCAAQGCRQMIARIGDAGNNASIALHEKLGFRRIGELRGVGFKFGRWVDVVEMQRTLSSADGYPSPAPPRQA